MKYINIILFILISISSSKWLPEVTGYSENDSENGYAGIIGKPIVGIKIHNTVFRVHTKNGGWSKEISGKYSGNGKPIDGLAIKGNIQYKVHLYDNGWLPAVNGYNINDSNNGFAGIINRNIDAVMIRGKKYAVSYIDSGIEDEKPKIYGKQVFVNWGTGLKDVSYQMKLPGMREGCLFMSACVIGGLGNDQQILHARKWAVKNGYIRDSDTYVNMSAKVLAERISKYYGTYYHYNWNFGEGRNHFWVIDEKGREVFNSAGLGYH